MEIPFVNTAVKSTSKEHQELLSIISSVMESGIFISGPWLSKFEKKLASLCNSRYAIGLNSGTDALIIAMKSLGIGRGDEVIVPANSFIAIPNAVSQTGAIPIFADVEENDLLISAKSIKPRISQRSKAIIAVHLTGLPCDLDPILEIAKNNKLFVIEDAAQAIGATYKNKPVGSLGDAACFSFHPLKNISSFGDGGAIVTNNKTIHGTAMRLRNHGLYSRDCLQEIGYNSRLDEIHAATLQYRLNNIKAITQKKQKIALNYTSNLKNCRVITEGKYRKGVYQLYMIRHHNRDALQTYLNKNGIQTAIHYATPNQNQAPYIGSGHGQILPVTNKSSTEILSLPIWTELPEHSIDYIINKINAFNG